VTGRRSNQLSYSRKPKKRRAPRRQRPRSHVRRYVNRGPPSSGVISQAQACVQVSHPEPGLLKRAAARVTRCRRQIFLTFRLRGQLPASAGCLRDDDFRAWPVNLAHGSESIDALHADRAVGLYRLPARKFGHAAYRYSLGHAAGEPSHVLRMKSRFPISRPLWRRIP